MKEQWKTVKYGNGKQNHYHYEVSSIGRMRKTNTRTGELVKCEYGKEWNKGYLRFSGIAGNAHRVVAKAFIPNPNNLPEIDHIDNDKKNNRVENLEWVTSSENKRRAVKDGLYDKVKEVHKERLTSKPAIRHDKKVYCFLNLKTGKMIAGRRRYLMDILWKFGISDKSFKDLKVGRINTCKGWTCLNPGYL